MAVKLESVTVENIGCFRGRHELHLQNDTEAIIGRSGTGKTTLTDAIYLCLSGRSRLRFSQTRHRDLQRDSVGAVDSAVSVVVADTQEDSRLRFTRTFRTSSTLRGSVRAVDSLDAEKQEDGEWVETRSAQAQNSVFPTQSLDFCIIDSESCIGNEDWGCVGLSHLIEALGEAAAKQSEARGTDLPEFFRDDITLRSELIDRTNERLSRVSRYKVEIDDGSLVGKKSELNKFGPGGLAAGDRQIISQMLASVAGELMPATPPLVGDSLYGRIDLNHRTKLHNVWQETDRQLVLFLHTAETDELKLTPNVRLALADLGPNCEITEPQ